MSDATHKIVLSPLGAAHTADSVQITADCGHEAWIAPTSHQAVRNPFMQTETVCLRCLDPEDAHKMIGPHGGLRALPGIRDELNAAIGVSETDQLWARFNVQERMD